MAGNVPNVSRNSFDATKFYDQIVQQQGVPVADSDMNEQASVSLFDRLIGSLYSVGNATLPASPNGTSPGYQIEEASTNTNNFQIAAGWAMVGGVLVPTVFGYPPTAHDYEDDTNYLFVGEISSVGSGNASDVDKYWVTAHVLTNCRMKMTSGTESGNTFTITGRVNQTTVSLSGGTGAIAPGDTYIIKPPALTTPGTVRVDEVYIMVFWEDINENEDSNIVNPALAIETSHRAKRRWCVRVAEGSTAPVTSDPHGFGFRYLKIADITRVASDATITTAMIANILGRYALAAMTSETIEYVPVLGSLFQGATVQAACEAASTTLQKQTAVSGAAYVGASAVSGSPDTLTQGTIFSQLASLLGFANNSVKTKHPAPGGTSWTLLWRGADVIDASVTQQIPSVYFRDGEYLIVMGCYTTGTSNLVTAGIAPTDTVSMLLFGSSGITFASKSAPTPGSTLSVLSSAAWDSFIVFGTGVAQVVKGPTVLSEAVTMQDTLEVRLASRFDGLVTTKSNVKMDESILQGDPADWDSTTIGQAFESAPSGIRSRMYYSATDMYITHNCYFDQSTSNWTADDSGGSLDALAWKFGASGMSVLVKEKFDGIATPWGNTVGAGNWSSETQYDWAAPFNRTEKASKLMPVGSVTVQIGAGGPSVLWESGNVNGASISYQSGGNYLRIPLRQNMSSVNYVVQAMMYEPTSIVVVHTAVKGVNQVDLARFNSASSAVQPWNAGSGVVDIVIFGELS